MAPHLLLITAVTALAALSSTAAAQESQAAPRAHIAPLSAGPAALPPVAEHTLERRTRESWERQRRDRLLGAAGMGLGATVIIGALVAWMGSDEITVSPGAAVALLGGMALTVWGGERHRSAATGDCYSPGQGSCPPGSAHPHQRQHPETGLTFPGRHGNE